MKKILIIAAMLFVIASCSKKESEKSKESENLSNDKNFPGMTDILVNGEVDPEGFIQASSFYNGSGHQYSFYGYFKNQPDDAANINVGNISANGENITLVTSENNSYKLEDNTLSNWIGNNFSITIAGGSGFNALNVNHASLNQFNSMTMSNVTGTNNSFVRTNNLTVNWNAGNSSDLVFIEVEYFQAASTTTNPSAPDTTLKKYVTVADNGSYSIPSSFFNPYPTNCICLVNIYRGNYENYNANSGKHLGVLTYSKATLKLNIL